jgi:succinate dehydrogenase/fumarate reductase flavoprotein subunit
MEKIQADLLIVGGGLAGLAAALAAQDRLERILLVTKGGLFQSGSTFVNRNGRWGLTFASTDPERELLYQTINTVSRGTNEPELSRLLVEESERAFRWLRDLGVEFLLAKGEISRVSPCFCSEPLAAVIRDTGQAAAALAPHLQRTRITILEQTAAERVIVEKHRLAGMLLRRGGTQLLVQCRAAILACGGNAALSPRNIVEPGLTGDGYELAIKAGLTLKNLEYQQRVWVDVDPGAPRFPAAALLDEKYQYFSGSEQLFPLHQIPSLDLASRRNHVPISNLQEDRAIDASLLNALPHSPDNTIHVTRNHTLINRIAPHVQVSNGGIPIGPLGETALPGLYAAGEITTGMHGGDRIGGMMITSCLVFGRRAGETAATYSNGG